MSREEGEDNTIYKVVVNHEEQYSIWPADRENALGWNIHGLRIMSVVPYEKWLDFKRSASLKGQWYRCDVPI